MKTILFKNKMFILLIFLFLILITCNYHFDSVNQPDLADPNSTFEVQITVRLEAEDRGGIPYFGIRLPTGWTVTDSISYSGALSGTLIYSAEMSDSMEIVDNSPADYYWWVSIGDTVDSLIDGTVSIKPRIQTGDQAGLYYIDYMLGDSGNGLNFRRSNDHPISVGIPPTTATVTHTRDNGEGSLRQVLADVSFGSEIIFDLSYPDTIVLDSTLVIEKRVTITGPETGQLIISGYNQERVFSINKYANVTIANLTISGGRGGIGCSDSDLNLNNVLITGNIVNDGNGGGIYCEKSDISLNNVKISGNIANGPDLNDDITSGNGGGIYCRSSNLSFSNVTITNNSASGGGGGIKFVDSSSIVFSSDSRSNIYFNHAFLGNDLYNDNASLVNVVLDTFTVLYPTNYHAYLPGNFSFDILNAKIEQYDSDLYVSSDGDNNNSGTTPSAALKTISFALSKIMADSLNPHTINLMNGNYTETSRINLVNYVSIKGASRSGVIFNTESIGGIRIHSVDGASLENMTIMGNGEALGIGCSNSDPVIKNVTLDGARMSLMMGSPHIENAKISGNNGEAGLQLEGSNSTLLNVEITDNIGQSTGGIHCGENAHINLINCTISGNRASDDNTGIGGIQLDMNSSLNIVNSILWYNFPMEIGSYVDFPDLPANISVTVTHSIYHAIVIIGDINEDWLDEVYVDTDPMFVDTANGDYRLQKDSPCIDAGIQDTMIIYNDGQDTLVVPPIAYLGSAPDMGAHEFDPSTGITEKLNVPLKYSLKQNYPNPFNPKTVISYQLPKSSNVKLVIYNLLGQKVATLISKKQPAGAYKVEWYASGFASGVYYYRIEAGEFQEVKKMILLR